MAENASRTTSPSEKSERTSPRKKPPPPPPPSSIRSLAESTPSMPVSAYRRPPPGPIDFASPRDLMGVLPPVESLAVSHHSGAKRSSVPLPGSPRAEPEASTRKAPPGYPPPPPPAADQSDELPLATPTDSATLPASYSQSTIQETSSRDPPTPPHSRSGTPTRPISPLFEAIDEIDALQSHRSSRPTTASSRRRSTHTRRSVDISNDNELPEVTPVVEGGAETKRRTSGYALSTRTGKSGDTERSERTGKSERTDKSDKGERDPKSRYLCESRSAAIKALYPDSPMAGGSSKGSVKSEKKKKDRDSRDSTKDSTRDSNRDSRELKREKSIADNGTWDTNSICTSNETNTQLSMG